MYIFLEWVIYLIYMGPWGPGPICMHMCPWAGQGQAPAWAAVAERAHYLCQCPYLHMYLHLYVSASVYVPASVSVSASESASI